jgi:aspartokinase
MATEAFSDFVVGHGELWCALLFCAACRVQAGDAAFMDTRDVLVVSRGSRSSSEVQNRITTPDAVNWAACWRLAGTSVPLSTVHEHALVHGLR